MNTLKYFSLVFFILMGCQYTTKTENKYYETGELKQKITKDSANCYTFIEYYKNGNKKLEGKICNENKVGKWKEWYTDGKLKWEGHFDKNRRTINYDKQNPTISIYGSPVHIYQDTSYLIRINMFGVHPEDMIVTSNNGIIQICKNRDKYDFVITPKKIGELKLVIYVMKDQKMYKIGEKCLIVNNK